MAHTEPKFLTFVNGVAGLGWLVTLKHVPVVVRGTTDTQPPKSTVPYKPRKVGAPSPLLTRDVMAATLGRTLRAPSASPAIRSVCIAAVVLMRFIVGPRPESGACCARFPRGGGAMPKPRAFADRRTIASRIERALSIERLMRANAADVF